MPFCPARDPRARRSSVERVVEASLIVSLAAVERVDGGSALVTGASSGIGEATVRALADAGFETVAAARRLERCEALAAEVGGRALRLDVADPDSVERARRRSCRGVDVIVHSAGGALGLEPVGEADEERLARDVGVERARRHAGDQGAAAGAAPGTRPAASSIVGSVAGVEVYEGGGGYTAAKHAAHALAQTLRLELLATGSG